MSGTVLFDLQRVDDLLVAAELSTGAVQRHRAALRAAREVGLVVLRARGGRLLRALGADDGGIAEPQCLPLWQLVAQVAPSCAEWAAWFQLSEGSRCVSDRQADDLFRDVAAFRAQVTTELGRLGKGSATGLVKGAVARHG